MVYTTCSKGTEFYKYKLCSSEINKNLFIVQGAWNKNITWSLFRCDGIWFIRKDNAG